MKKISVYDGIVLCLLTYTISTMVYNLLPSFLPLNRILGVLLFVMIAWLYIATLKKRDFWVACILIITSVSAAVVSVGKNSIEHIQYFTIVILFINKLIDEEIRRKLIISLRKYDKLNLFVIISMALLTVSTFFIDSCYVSNGEEIVLSGFCPHSHTFCSCMCLLMSFSLFYFLDKKIKLQNVSIFLPFVFAIFEGGARTFLISAIIILVLFYLLKLKGYPMKPVILICGVAILGYVFLNSSMFSRFQTTSENQYISDNALEAATSGRLIWWKYDIEAYMELPLINKLIGAGYDLVYEVNEIRYGMRLWAHNDFIQILVSIGLFGIAVYVKYILEWIFKISNKSPNRIIGILFGVYILWAAFINGFYIYQHYFFSTIILSLTLQFSIDHNKNLNYKKIELIGDRDEN